MSEHSALAPRQRSRAALGGSWKCAYQELGFLPCSQLTLLWALK